MNDATITISNGPTIFATLTQTTQTITWHGAPTIAANTGTLKSNLTAANTGTSKPNLAAAHTGTPNPNLGATDSDSPPLPPNLEMLGGLDVTKQQGYGFKEGLWNFSGAYKVQSVDLTPSVAKSKRASQPYRIPAFLQFSPATAFNRKRISGETRESYQSNYSSSSGLNEGFLGFSAEMSSSFSFKDSLETYKKYAGCYQVVQIYQVNLFDAGNAMTLRQYLSDDAKGRFASMSAEDIVRIYGTHYFTSASFGGWKRDTYVSGTDSVLDTVS